MRRLFTSAALQHASQQGLDDDLWGKSFKLSYGVGAAVIKGTDSLPASIDESTSGSHILRLCMQHQQLVAPAVPVAAQGTSC